MYGAATGPWDVHCTKTLLEARKTTAFESLQTCSKLPNYLHIRFESKDTESTFEERFQCIESFCSINTSTRNTVTRVLQNGWKDPIKARVKPSSN